MKLKYVLYYDTFIALLFKMCFVFTNIRKVLYGNASIVLEVVHRMARSYLEGILINADTVRSGNQTI